MRGREDAFYDFATKYLDDAAELDVPAKIDDDVADAVRQLAIRAFRAIDCQGLARVDFFLTENGPVINEINTMPGFTTISMYPRMWAASGVDYPTLLATMVETAAEARHRSALADRRRVNRLGGQGLCDRSGDLLDGRRTRARRQRQRDIDRAVDDEPRAAFLIGDSEPLDGVDDLDGGADDELCRDDPPRNAG